MSAALYNAFVRSLENPVTLNRRMTRKAAIRVASELEGSDQIPTTVLTRTLSSFLNCRMYGSIGSMEDNVDFNAAASEILVRREWTDKM